MPSGSATHCSPAPQLLRNQCSVPHAGFPCDTGFYCKVSTCAKKPLNGACDTDPCPEGLFCTDGNCDLPADVGNPCTPETGCQRYACDAKTLKCRDYAPGDPCEGVGTSTSLTCDYPSNLLYNDPR